MWTSFFRPDRNRRIPAAKIKNGTTFSNEEAGATSSKILPPTLPMSERATKVSNFFQCPRSSFNEEAVAPIPEKMSAVVLVTFAITGGTPIAKRAG